MRRCSPAGMRSALVTDRVREARARADGLHASLPERRARLIRHLHYRYDVTVYPHPRLPHVVVVSESDAVMLRYRIGGDRTLDAVGRGYYSWLGGELTVQVAPDWACDATRLALARLYVVTLHRPLSRLARALTRLLPPHKG